MFEDGDATGAGAGQSNVVATAIAQLNAHLDHLDRQFIGRRGLLELILLGVITREHVLLIGPPGTGKSAAVQAVARSLNTQSFEYLIGRFTEPSELFGGLDLNALKDGKVRPITAGMLPEAEIAFLDEIFLGSTAILNTLLKILNERTYRRGQYQARTPLLSCVAASNNLPTDPQLEAFADRFQLTMFVDPVTEDQLPGLLETGWGQFQEDEAGLPVLDKGLLAELHKAMLGVDLEPVREAYAHIIRKLRLIGVTVSDRKVIKGQKSIAAAALLRGQTVAGAEDLWPITYMVQDKAQQKEVSQLLEAELKASANPVLTNSVVQATYGPTAHAAALTDQATRLLESPPADEQTTAREIWLVRLETMRTQIRAAFSEKDMPEALAAIDTRIKALLEPAPPETDTSPDTD